MYDREQMKEALGKLSWKTVVALIEGTNPPDSEEHDQLAEDLVRRHYRAFREERDDYAGRDAPNTWAHRGEREDDSRKR